MSYILDALVKADQQRQRQGVPGLHTIQAAVLPERVQPRRWHVMLSGVVLTAALLSLAWLQPWHREATDAMPVPLQMAAGKPAAPTIPVGKNMTAVAAQEAVVVEVTEPPGAVAVPRQKSAKAEPNRPRSEAPAREAVAATPAPPAPVVAEAKADAKPEARLYSVAELPAALKKEAQKISIAGFAYAADPNDRMAIINDRAMREGDEVAAGLRIEQISGDGVVFSLKGYRFHKGGL